MTKGLRRKLQENVEWNPEYSGSSYHGFGQQNSVSASPGASAVLKNSLDEDDLCAAKSTAAANDNICHTKKYRDMDEDRRYIVDSSATQLSGTTSENGYVVDLLTDNETSCDSHAPKKEEAKIAKREAVDETKSDDDEAIEALKLSNLSDNIKFDSFDDVLNYQKKYGDKKYLDNFIVDESTEISDHDQSDNDFVRDDEPFLSLQRHIPADDDLVNELCNINDVPFEEHPSHLYLGEQSHTGNSANKIDEEQSSSRHNLQNLNQEWIGDVATNKLEKLIISGDPNDTLPSETEDLIDSGKISELMNDSSKPAMETSIDSSVHKEDIANTASERYVDKDDISSHR